VRIIIKCPESNSPRRGRIHLRGLSFRTSSNLLQFDGGPYIFANQPPIPIENANRQATIRTAHHAANNAQSSLASLSPCLLSNRQAMSPVTKRVDPRTQTCNVNMIGVVTPALFPALYSSRLLPGPSNATSKTKLIMSGILISLAIAFDLCCASQIIRGHSQLVKPGHFAH
jgi:hypothetical protein